MIIIWICLTNVFSGRDSNNTKIIFALILIMMIQTVHNFAHVTTAMLLWHKQNCELIRGLFCKQEQQIFFFFYKIWIMSS